MVSKGEHMVGSKTILCIEDDHFISELYKRALEKAGFDVETTVSGKDGLDMALKRQYDVILLDIMTPDMTGIEVLNEIRGHDDKLPETSILVTTNLDQTGEIRNQIERMADGYLIKAEITPSKLVELIKSLPERG